MNNICSADPKFQVNKNYRATLLNNLKHCMKSKNEGIGDPKGLCQEIIAWSDPEVVHVWQYEMAAVFPWRVELISVFLMHFE